MDKSKFYVSVSSKTVLPEQGTSAYEWEVEATDEEAAELRDLLETLEEDEHATHFRGMTPGVPYHMDRENDEYDAKLKRIYSTIQKLGTPETQHGIAEVMQNLEGIGREVNE